MEDNLSLLVGWFEASEQASIGGRAESTRCREYYDGKQLSDAEKKALKRRRQPEVVKNRIFRKINYLRGLERQSRTDPKAFPRTPQHEEDADACTDALRYVKADQNLDVKRSAVFENMLIEGFGGVEIGVVKSRGDVVDPKITLLPWDRLFYDPNSAAHDFSDARYMGFLTWMDVEDAKARPEWKGKEAIIDATLAKPLSTFADTYDDKPRWGYWADPKRKRIRVVTMYYIHAGVWHRCEFTLAGHLTDPAPSPFIDEDGNPENAMVLQSAYIDGDNDRYGEVRNMLSPQDELNKRGSKALHLLNTRQVRVSRSVTNLEEVRREIAKPDGVINADKGEVEVLSNTADASGHLQLMQLAMAELDGTGPNATMQGKSEGPDQSGRAILALQQGGMVEMTPLLDNLRHFSIRVYRQIWNRIRQYWTTERWVRVTDDEDKSVRFTGLNVTRGALAMRKLHDAFKEGKIDEATAQQYAAQINADPEMAKPANVVAELDVDIDIDEMNETPSLQFEQFQALTSLATAGLAIPPEVIIQASSLRDKGKLLKMIEAAGAQPDPQRQLAEAGAQATVQKTQAEAALTGAKAENEALRAELARLALALNSQPAPVAPPAVAWPQAEPIPAGIAA